MPVAKKAKAPAPESTAPDFSMMVDELGALEKELAPIAQKVARIELLRKQLRAACPVPAVSAWTVEGKRFMAILGPRANERIIDVPKLVRLISAKAFSLFATTTLTALEKHTSPTIMAAVVTMDATGSRPLKTFERGGGTAG